MPRYVDTEAFKVYMRKKYCEMCYRKNPIYFCSICKVEKAIKDVLHVPTADVQEVKHAHWSCVNEDECYHMCTVCGNVLSLLILGSPEDYDIGYCPFCGAKWTKRRKEMNDNIKGLLELIKENPELPIVCMVESEIVGSDDYGRWLAQIGGSVIGEFATYNDRFYDDREEFTEAYYINNDDILDERFGYNPNMSYPGAQKRYLKSDIEANKEAEARLNKYLDEVADCAFTKAILVYINTTDDYLGEFKDEEE